MKNIKKILCFLFLFMLLSLDAGAESKLEPDDISSSQSAAVRSKIAKLYSSKSIERAQAAYDLGEMGTRAKASIPDLIGILSDDSSHITLPSGYVDGLGYQITTPAEEASTALSKMGKLAITALISVLQNENATVRKRANDALIKITGIDFGEDISKWQKWYHQNKEK